MSSLYCLSPESALRFARLAFLMISAGVALCVLKLGSGGLFPGETLTSQVGEKYAVSGKTFTPAPNVLHEDTFMKASLSSPGSVKRKKGGRLFGSGDPGVLIPSAATPPTITGQVALSSDEDQPFAIEVSHLVVTDPDGDPMTLSILAGDNYTVSGNQVTPARNFNGDLTVRVFVNDGTANSNIFDLIITVNPVNDPPVITSQRAIEIVEETPVSLLVSDVVAEDPDNTFPEGFTINVQPGENYTNSGNTVTPSADFNGTLTVNVVVNDGQSNSQPFPLAITVTAQNDAPEITGQQPVSTNEESALEITLANLIVNDPDNAYPADFSLVIFGGLNYTATGNTILPAPDYSGPLTVQVQVSDGSLNSNLFNLAVNVIAVNDKPVITGQIPVETPEDTPVTILPLHLTVMDPDNTFPIGFTLTISAGANYTVIGTTIQPATDYNGTLNVPVVVNDGLINSEPFSFQIQVGNANDAPLITGQAVVATDEEVPVTLTLSQLIVVDPDNTYPAGFSLLVSPGANYTVAGETITPAIDFAGTLTIPVRVSDGINNSPSFDFQLQVNQINDPPSFAAIANQQIAENTPAGSVTISGISKGPMEDDQLLTFIATSSNTAIIEDPVIQYNGTGRSAVLSYVVKPNTSGIVTLTIVAVDNGSNVAPHQNSFSSGFQVEVLEVNTAPTLDPISNVSIQEDAEQQNVPLTGISPGEGETQSMTVTVSTNKADFFELLEVAYTSPAADGLLQFKTKENVFGTAAVSVTVTDNGSGIAPNVNKVTRKFSVVVEPVNDLPAFTSVPVTVAVIQEDYRYNITVADPDGERIVVSAPVKPSWATLTANGSHGVAILHGKPPAGSLGNFDVQLEAKDATSTVGQSFTIYVNVRPSLTGLSIATEEDVPLAFSSAFFASGYSDQNDNPLEAIEITTLPASGRLTLAGVEVKARDTIPAASLAGLTYTPGENFSGNDSFAWNASDGYHFSKTTAPVDISVLAVNDPARVVLKEDTLKYEVNGESAFLVPDLEIIDPDNDTLINASVAFSATGYRFNMDVLQFQATPNIRGSFDVPSGVLRLTGTAPLSEYETALQSIQYTHRNTVDPILEPKAVTFVLNDGETGGDPGNKVISLQYTFVEFEIPSGFTPNGDLSNDTWIIDRPGGGLDGMDDAIISVYNKQGVLVYRAVGFEKPWDGTMDGEALPADTYFFTIDLQLRNKKTYKGIVTILR